MHHAELEDFVSRFSDPELVCRIAHRAGVEPVEAERRLAIYQNEAYVGLSLIGPMLRGEARILEVGSGLCILSLYLKFKGYDITALEPVGSGFGFFMAALPEIIAAVPEVELTILPIGAEALDAREQGYFTLIFSVHVLEHVPDLAAVFRGMKDVLHADGKMVHLCPNYQVPYEPHFARPLVPLLPHLSRPMMGRRDDLPGVWESLNFITHRRVSKLARRNGLEIEFERGLMAAALRRLNADPEYALRHASPVMRMLGKLAGRPVFGAVLGQVPASWGTPMQFRLSHKRSAL